MLVERGLDVVAHREQAQLGLGLARLALVHHAAAVGFQLPAHMAGAKRIVHDRAVVAHKTQHELPDVRLPTPTSQLVRRKPA